MRRLVLVLVLALPLVAAGQAEMLMPGDRARNTARVFPSPLVSLIHAGPVRIGDTAIPTQKLEVNGSSILDGTVSLYPSQPAKGVSLDIFSYAPTANLTANTTTERSLVIAPAYTYTLAGAQIDTVVGVESSGSVTFPTAGQSGGLVYAAFKGAPTLTTQANVNVFSTFRFFDGEPLITSATSGASLPSVAMLFEAPNLQANAQDLTAATSVIQGVNAAEQASTTGTGAKLTVTDAAFQSAPTYSSGTSGNVLTVTARRGLWVNDPTYTATGTVTVTDNTAVEIDSFASTSGNRTVTRNTGIKSGLNTGTGGTTTLFINATGTAASKWGGLFTTYNNVALVDNGMPSELAHIDLTGQSAAIAATTLYAVPAAAGGMYRVCWVATVTTAATTSSVLGGAGGFQIVYTDFDTNVAKTMPGTVVTGVDTNATNSTATGTISGCFAAYVKASTTMQYQIGYTSVGVTAMVYNLHIKVEAM